MAKTEGRVNERTGRVEADRVRKVKEIDFPVTIVDTRAKRIARSLWG